MTSRGDIKNQVLRLLNKTSLSKGFFTDDKLNDGIQDALDYIETKMMMAGEGWNNVIEFQDVTPGDQFKTLPTGTVMLNALMYRVGDVYVPLHYDTDEFQLQTAQDSGQTQYPGSYRVVDNQVYFNPPLAQGGTAYLRYEITRFSNEIGDDVTDYDSIKFNRAFLNFVKYWAATYVASTANLDNFSIPWKEYQDKWEFTVQQIISKRNYQTQYIREFEGY